MKIFYCDEHIIVCIKPSGAVSTEEPGGMPELIRQAIGEDCTVRAVHRLDSMVSGLMVYALSKEAASGLTRQMEDDTFRKEYMAVVEGKPEQEQGKLHDYLLRNKRERKTYVADRRSRDAQEAILTYRTCGKTADLSLVRIRLQTGRTHQIRCQFSARHLPLYGDGKYGSSHPEERIALWSCRLSFRHPISGAAMDFSALPPAKSPWSCFRGQTAAYDEQDLVVEFRRSHTFSDCPFAEDCGFCTYQGMEYEKQLEKKQKKLTRWFRELGTAEPMLPAEQPSGYKNRLTLDFGIDKSGRLISGVYSRKAKRVVPIGKCPIDHPKLREIASSLRVLLIRHEIPIFDSRSKQGWLRQATLRISTGDDVMVMFSTVSAPIVQSAPLAQALAAAHPEIRSILVEVRGTGAQHLLWGADNLEEFWMNQPFTLHANTFFPVNPAQSAKIYQIALEYAALTAESRVLDICCGSGVLALAAAQAKRVLAVESSKEVLAEAIDRAKRVKAESIRFIHAEPEAYLEALARSHEVMDVLFFEASRCRTPEGCIAAIGRLQPRKIIYIGKDPERTGTDLKSLVTRGYTVQKIQPVDLLPFTEHVESVVLLARTDSAI